MKQNKSVKVSGPYKVTSHSQGSGMVYFMVYPAFPDYDYEGHKWAETRFNQEGGGPGIFTAIATAEQLELFLNSVYSEDDIKSWKDIIEKILDQYNKEWVFAECESCGTVSSVKDNFKYCPICGEKYKISK